MVITFTTIYQPAAGRGHYFYHNLPTCGWAVVITFTTIYQPAAGLWSLPLPQFTNLRLGRGHYFHHNLPTCGWAVVITFTTIYQPAAGPWSLLLPTCGWAVVITFTTIYKPAAGPWLLLLSTSLHQCAASRVQPPNHVAANSLSPQVARKGSTLSGFVQRSRLEREVGRDLHSNKWEEV